MIILVAHAQFVPERRHTLDRLLEQLKPHAPSVFMSKTPEHSSVWARRMWEEAARYDGDAILLNDDVEVSPDLVPAVEAMLAATDAPLLSLHTSLPIARSLANAGQRWLRTYWLTGPAYVFRRGVAKTLLAYADSLPPAWYHGVNEDVVCNQWAYANRRPILSCIPALAQHDTGVKSLLGYDSHSMRTTSVPWDDPSFAGVDLKTGWEIDAEPVFVETNWSPSAALDMNERALRAGMTPGLCWWCGEERPIAKSDKTAALVCASCIVRTVEAFVRRK